MGLYRLHIKWKEKEIVLQAKTLDMTHPYFVSIKDIVFPKATVSIINPSADEIVKEFGQAKNLMFPFQSVILIEEIFEEEKKEKNRAFEVIQTQKTGK